MFLSWKKKCHIFVESNGCALGLRQVAYLYPGTNLFSMSTQYLQNLLPAFQWINIRCLLSHSIIIAADSQLSILREVLTVLSLSFVRQNLVLEFSACPLWERCVSKMCAQIGIYYLSWTGCPGYSVQPYKKGYNAWYVLC